MILDFEQEATKMLRTRKWHNSSTLSVTGFGAYHPLRRAIGSDSLVLQVSERREETGLPLGCGSSKSVAESSCFVRVSEPHENLVTVSLKTR
jgi:hypothetical protein